MKKIVQLLGRTFLISLGIGSVVLVIGWLSKWASATQFSDGFFWAGAILITIGSMSVVGGSRMRADGSILYSQSAGDMNTFERSKIWVSDTMQGYGAFTFLLLIGSYLMLFAILAANLF